MRTTGWFRKTPAEKMQTQAEELKKLKEKRIQAEGVAHLSELQELERTRIAKAQQKSHPRLNSFLKSAKEFGQDIADKYERHEKQKKKDKGWSF